MFDLWRGMAEINDATERLEEATDQTLGVLGGSSSSFWRIRMMRLEDVKAGALIQGIEPGEVVRIVASEQIGKDIIVANKPDDPSTIDVLKQAIEINLVNNGFVKCGTGYQVDGQLTKQRIREIHSNHRIQTLHKNNDFIQEYYDELIKNFADGSQVNPSLISPELIEVKSNSYDSRLFRFACLLWSVPVSQGFGRRIRFIVRDRQNGCLIGLFAIGDPVFNLSARDRWIDWQFEDRKSGLKHIMDAYVVGSVPPYSMLIGGKLIAALMASSEVIEAYNRKYIGKETVIGHTINQAQLVLLTTTSSMGRSSLYNRLSIPGGPQFVRIGETRGFGHFHFSGEIFESMKEYLESVGHPYARGNRFGMGPNWKMRVIRAVLDRIGLDSNNTLNHGIAREVYAIPLAKNWQAILHGHTTDVSCNTLTADEISNFCLNRWMIPRATRDTSFSNFDKRKIMVYLQTDKSTSKWD